jgi:glycosyltransferase involved in cell wall biosynthesis
MGMRIGIIATRLAGTDGVSLETAKVAAVLERLGHQCFYCAGELEEGRPGLLVPELHFEDPVAQALGRRAFGPAGEDPALLAAIGERARELQAPLRRFLAEYGVEYVVVENAFAIPMQLPLAQALVDLLRELNLPGLAHSHDFYWERERFAVHALGSFLDTYFPPALPGLRHAVINSAARRALRERRGLDSLLIPNVFDFDTPPPGIDEYNADFRQAIGLAPDDWLILQPTRVIPRKGIELAIELVAALDDPRARLVITHRAGDEGFAYLEQLEAQARALGVDLRYVADQVDERRGTADGGRKSYSLWDAYPHADFVAYPSLYEGFGNALLETIYFRRPALVNRYPVYAEDIGPLGFQFVEIDGRVTAEAVEQVRRWLDRPELAAPIVERNFQLGREHFSLATLAGRLAQILPA